MRRGLWLCCLLLCTCEDAGTGPDSGTPAEAGTSRRSADAADGSHEDLRSSVAAVLMQRDRSARLTCDCRADEGAFESFDDCVNKTGYDMGLIECLSSAFAQFDSPVLREQMACELLRSKRYNTCLESASCADIANGACYRDLAECTMPDPQVLTHVLSACPGAAVLSR